MRLIEECTWLDVATAVEHRAYTGDVDYARSRPQLIAAFEDNPSPVLRAKRRDGLNRMRALIWAMANAADHEVQSRRRGQMLVSVPHRVLAERIGVRSTKTVQRLLRIAEAAGHVACVREGCTDELRAPSQAEDGNTIPVYVLLIPRSPADANQPPAPLPDQPAERAVERPSAPARAHGDPRRLSLVDVVPQASVHEDVHPSRTPVGSSWTHPYTRERATPAAPLRGTAHPLGDAARRRPGTSPGTRVEPPRPDVRWPAFTTASTKRERLYAAEELRHRLPPLRRLSTGDVASLCREHFLAGWTVADIVHAVDHLPSGAPHPHSGADGVDLVRGWLRRRLAFWRDARGTVARSRTQSADADREHARRQRAARTAREQHERPARTAATSAVSAQVRARAHADAARLRRAREARRHLVVVPDVTRDAALAPREALVPEVTT